jgi:hypothetical protein
MMTLMTVRVALEYLWDQQYTVQSVASTRWQLTPPPTGRRVDVPLRNVSTTVRHPSAEFTDSEGRDFAPLLRSRTGLQAHAGG